MDLYLSFSYERISDLPVAGYPRVKFLLNGIVQRPPFRRSLYVFLMRRVGYAQQEIGKNLLVAFHGRVYEGTPWKGTVDFQSCFCHKGVILHLDPSDSLLLGMGT